MTFDFLPIEAEQIYLRMALIGVAGSGKSYTSLRTAVGLASDPTKVFVLDTENGSAARYAKEFRGVRVCKLTRFDPADYAGAIQAAVKAGAEAIVVDSLTHAWSGKGGALEQADQIGSRPGENRFTAWRHITPKHNALVEAMVSLPCHLIVTMRVKTEYIIEENDRRKKVPRKVGIAPVQRDGLEYEFDVVADMVDATLHVTKTRSKELKGKSWAEPGEEFVQTLKFWMSSAGAEPEAPLVERVQSAASLAELEELRPLLSALPKGAERSACAAAYNARKAEMSAPPPQPAPPAEAPEAAA